VGDLRLASAGESLPDSRTGTASGYHVHLGKIGLTSSISWVALAAVLAGTQLGCSGGGSRGGTGGISLTGGSGGGGANSATGGTSAGSGGAGSGSGGSSGTGGAAGPLRQTMVRFLQGYLRQGVKGTFDLGSRDRAWAWSYAAQNVTYGTLTDYLPLPVTDGSALYIWFLPAGADPANYTFTNDNALTFVVPPTATARHTLFFHYTDDVTQFAGQLVEDADPALVPPDGWSYVAFNTDAVRAQFPTLDYQRTGACIERATQDNYQPVAPGSVTFSIYNGTGATGCQGNPIASSPPTTIGNKEVWMLYTMGDSANGFQIRPVKMTRN